MKNFEMNDFLLQDHTQNYGRSYMFYYVMVARLAFVIIFEVNSFHFSRIIESIFLFSIWFIWLFFLFEISLHVYHEMFEFNLIEVAI